MKKIYTLILAGLMCVSPLAVRADMSIAVLDMQQILAESAAAKSILDQIKAKRTTLEAEAKKLEDGLKKDDQAMVKKKETETPEEFAKSRKAFEKKLIEARTKIQKMRKDIDGSFNGAIDTLRDHILKVTAKIAEDKKITLVMTKQNIVLGDKDLDITADVMSALNADVKTIKLK
jgi:Skp family chaperone for outer membrane proteins